jgi:hypothetical protein
LDVKALTILVSVLMLCGHAVTDASPQPSDLGRLSNYYRDCPASRGPHTAYLRKVLRRALAGEHAAMRSVIMHDGFFSTGDNEGYSEVPQALLRTLGDSRYAAFVARQPRNVHDLALAFYPEQIPAFEQRFPRTAKLYHARSSRHPRNV